MLTLTRPQRQGLTTLALVAFSVAPTAFVAATAWRLSRPGYARDVEVELGREIGRRVTIEAARHPRPGEVAYRGLVVRRDDGRRGGLVEIVRADALRVRRGGREVVVAAEGLTLRADGPAEAAAHLGDLLRRLGGPAGASVAFAAPSCSLVLGPGLDPIEVRDVAGTLGPGGESPAVRVSFRVDGDGEAVTRCELELSPGRPDGRAGDAVALRTMEGPPLPARVLRPFFDPDAWLGPEARVWGTLEFARAGASGWEATFRGELIDVDLHTLVGRRFPGHRLTGRARVAVREARWADRPGQGFGWASAEGELAAGQGSMGVDLLRALASEMRFRLGTKAERLDPSHVEVAYRALGLGFRLDPDGQIHLAGACGTEYAPGVVLVAANQVSPLAFAPDGAASVRGLLKALYPAGGAEVLVPATAESQAVQRFLPLPPGLADAPRRLNAH